MSLLTLGWMQSIVASVTGAGGGVGGITWKRSRVRMWPDGFLRVFHSIHSCFRAAAIYIC